MKSPREKQRRLTALTLSPSYYINLTQNSLPSYRNPHHQVEKKDKIQANETTKSSRRHSAGGQKKMGNILELTKSQTLKPAIKKNTGVGEGRDLIPLFAFLCQTFLEEGEYLHVGR